jgi:hypothetical protein
VLILESVQLVQRRDPTAGCCGKNLLHCGWLCTRSDAADLLFGRMATEQQFIYFQF